MGFIFGGSRSIFARNSARTQERWVVRFRGRLHRDSRWILPNDAALLWKFRKIPIPQTYTYYSKGILFVAVYRNLSLLGELRLWVFSWTSNSTASSKFKMHYFLWSYVPFLVSQRSIFARNTFITRERLVLRSWGRFYRFSSRILPKDVGLQLKYWKSPHTQKFPYYI